MVKLIADEDSNPIAHVVTRYGRGCGSVVKISCLTQNLLRLAYLTSKYGCRVLLATYTAILLVYIANLIKKSIITISY